MGEPPSLIYLLRRYAPCFDISLLPTTSSLSEIDQIVYVPEFVQSDMVGDPIPLLHASYTFARLARIGLERSVVPDPLPPPPPPHQ